MSLNINSSLSIHKRVGQLYRQMIGQVKFKQDDLFSGEFDKPNRGLNAGAAGLIIGLNFPIKFNTKSYVF